MSDETVDELGPIDYLVIEFPPEAQHFDGEMARELLSLVDSEMIRVLDLLVIAKDADGGIEALELDDLEEAGDLARLETEIAEILAEEDVVHLAEAMEPGTVAGVLVFENLWAAPFAAAARHAGGQLIASGRIPIQAIVASLEAEAAAETEGD